MRTSVTAREKERAERATLVQQEKLSKAKVGPHEHWTPERLINGRKRESLSLQHQPLAFITYLHLIGGRITVHHVRRGGCMR